MTEAKKRFLAMMVRLGKISTEEYESVTGEPGGTLEERVAVLEEVMQDQVMASMGTTSTQ